MKNEIVYNPDASIAGMYDKKGNFHSYYMLIKENQELRKALKGYKYCPYCGQKLRYSVETDINTPLICKNELRRSNKTVKRFCS